MPAWPVPTPTDTGNGSNDQCQANDHENSNDISNDISKDSSNDITRVFAENLVGLGLHVVCFLPGIQNQSQPKENYLLWEKKLVWLVAFGWGVRRFHNNIYSGV